MVAAGAIGALCVQRVVVMKSLAIGVAAVMCVGLGACAGTVGSSRFDHNEALGQHVDVGKVVAVNRWASQRGATVLWINYPTRPTRKDQPGG